MGREYYPGSPQSCAEGVSLKDGLPFDCPLWIMTEVTA